MEAFSQGFVIGFMIAVIGGTIHYAIVTKLAVRKMHEQYKYFFAGYESPMFGPFRKQTVNHSK